MLTAIVACAWISLACGQATVVEVVPLQYRTPEQVIPVLQPLLDRSGSISGIQNQLVIRTTPKNLAELRQVLASIDTRPRRLVITVRQDAGTATGRSAAEVSGRAVVGDGAVAVSSGSGERGGAAVEAGRGDSRVEAQVLSTRSLEHDRTAQTVQVLEGSEAFIRLGQSVPVRTRTLVRNWVGGVPVDRYVESVEYRDALAGFYVKPRVTGERVTLDISSQRDTVGGRVQAAGPGPGTLQEQPVFNVQRVGTTVSGRLGEWIEVGGVAQDLASQQSGIVFRTQTSGADNRRVLLKVEEIR